MAQRIDPVLQARLRQRPEELVRVIVRVSGDMPLALVRLNELDCTVHRHYQLLPAVAVSCSGEKALGLLSEKWVLSLEEDRLVSTQACNQANKT